jgi:ParB family protein of integrating conjugative element (PFGI_1 class)
MKPEPAASQGERVADIAERQTPRSRQPSIEERRRLVSESLNVGNPPNNARALPEVADLKFDCQMELEVDAIKPYDRNPRRANNAKFAEIKESIRVSGIRNPLTVTRRPGDGSFIVEAGGNTRLLAIQQLWAETKDSRFQKIIVMFRPWRSESHVLTAHLIENEQRGELTFWDMANGVMALKAQLESEKGRALSLRELEEELKRLGLSTNRSSLSRWQFATVKLGALGAAASSLSTSDVKIIQPRLNLMKRYAEKRAGTSEAQLYEQVLKPVFERHRHRYTQAYAVNATGLCRDCEEALAEYFGEAATRLRLMLDALEKAPDISAEHLAPKAGVDPHAMAAEMTQGSAPEVHADASTVTRGDTFEAATKPAGRNSRSPPTNLTVTRGDSSAPALKSERLDRTDPTIVRRPRIDTDTHRDRSTRHVAPATSSESLASPELLKPVGQRVTQFAELTGVCDCLKFCEAMPCGYYIEAPQVPLDLDPDKPLRHRAWWLLALISGQMDERVSQRLPVQSSWRRVHAGESGDETAFALLIENELGGALGLDVLLADWLLDPTDEAAAVFWELVVLVRHVRGAAPQRFAIPDYSNASKDD